MSEPTKDETPAAPIQAQGSAESTPIGDEAEKASKANLEDVDEADVTRFEEDDDPKALAGDFIDENDNGIDDRKEKSDG